MYNGWPVAYADIRAGETFQRNVAKTIERQLQRDGKPIVVLLGASGVGKTSAARQAMAELSKTQFAWEHKAERPLMADKWHEVARILCKDGKSGVLIIDDAHHELSGINELVEDLARDGNTSLKLTAVAHWTCCK